MLAVRSQHRAFGRGTQKFLYPGNRKVLAYLREYAEDGTEEVILCVSNLSRTAQAVELELSAFSGRTPVDLVGGSVFPPVGQLTYLLTLPPYAFYWFVLAPENALPSWHRPAPEPLPEYATIVVRRDLEEVLWSEGPRHSGARGAAGVFAEAALVRIEGRGAEERAPWRIARGWDRGWARRCSPRWKPSWVTARRPYALPMGICRGGTDDWAAGAAIGVDPGCGVGRMLGF